MSVSVQQAASRIRILLGRARRRHVTRCMFARGDGNGIKSAVNQFPGLGQFVAQLCHLGIAALLVNFKTGNGNLQADRLLSLSLAFNLQTDFARSC